MKSQPLAHGFFGRASLHVSHYDVLHRQATQRHATPSHAIIVFIAKTFSCNGFEMRAGIKYTAIFKC